MCGVVRRWVTTGRARLSCDDGNAMIEFIFVGLILLVPLVYLLVALSAVQRNTYGVTQAAREAGRTFARTGDAAAAAYAADLALRDQHVPTDEVRVGATGIGGSCDDAIDLDGQLLAPGNVFTLCVARAMTIPGIPSFVDAHRNTVTGKFVVHVDDYAVQPAAG